MKKVNLCERPQLNQQERSQRKSILSFISLLITAIRWSGSSINWTVQFESGAPANGYNILN